MAATNFPRATSDTKQEDEPWTTLRKPISPMRTSDGTFR